jgi:hypothetical protein
MPELQPKASIHDRYLKDDKGKKKEEKEKTRKKGWRK